MNSFDEIIKNILASKDNESKYLKIIELGKKLPPFPIDKKTEKNRVKECQSNTYIYTYLENKTSFDKTCFMATSDALITSGLCYILISKYNMQPYEVILKKPPLFIKKLNLYNFLSPTRSHGFLQIYLKMKEDIKNLIN